MKSKSLLLLLGALAAIAAVGYFAWSFFFPGSVAANPTPNNTPAAAAVNVTRGIFPIKFSGANTINFAPNSPAAKALAVSTQNLEV